MWTEGEMDGNPALNVKASAMPSAARAWVVNAPTRDFRKATWSERPVAVDGQTVTAAVEKPSTGYRAFYAELDYDLDGLTYRICTTVRVLGK
jgi:PhoPQ-activated pathogenicity-related protein